MGYKQEEFTSTYCRGLVMSTQPDKQAKSPKMAKTIFLNILNLRTRSARAGDSRPDFSLSPKNRRGGERPPTSQHFVRV
jgi:hypothetical protein